jgi:hypothetical protein
MSVEAPTAITLTEPDAMMKRIFKVAEIIERNHQNSECKRNLLKKAAEKLEDREIEYREGRGQLRYP